MEGAVRIVEGLPVHPVPEALPGPEDWRLRVDGLVAAPLTLTLADVLALQAQAVAADFICEEGWTAPDQQWDGVPVAAVLRAAGPLPGAAFVRVHAGDYTVLLPLDEATGGGALLAHRLNGAALTPAHGAPLRLVAPGRACFWSVKWVDRLEVLAEEAPVTGEAIARARLTKAAPLD